MSILLYREKKFSHYYRILLIFIIILSISVRQLIAQDIVSQSAVIKKCTKLDVPVIMQPQDLWWCWAACLEMTSKYYEGDLAQCEIVNISLNQDECCDPNPDEDNCQDFYRDFPEFLECGYSAIENIISTETTTPPLTFEFIKEQIDKGYPIMYNNKYTCFNCNPTGHVMLITGYCELVIYGHSNVLLDKEKPRWVIVNDPMTSEKHEWLFDDLEFNVDGSEQDEHHPEDYPYDMSSYYIERYTENLSPLVFKIDTTVEEIYTQRKLKVDECKFDDVFNIYEYSPEDVAANQSSQRICNLTDFNNAQVKEIIWKPSIPIPPIPPIPYYRIQNVDQLYSKETNKFLLKNKAWEKAPELLSYISDDSGNIVSSALIRRVPTANKEVPKSFKKHRYVYRMSKFGGIYGAIPLLSYISDNRINNMSDLLAVFYDVRSHSVYVAACINSEFRIDPLITNNFLNPKNK